jgi:hypothetical protein
MGEVALACSAALPCDAIRIMSLLPEGASFEELVQDYFLAVRGAGLMLNALDTELLTSWAREGVPFEVVARGISRSAEKALWDARPGEPVLRSLRACRRQVEAEIKKYRHRSAGAGEAGTARRKPLTWEETRHARLRASLERLAERRPELTHRVGQLLEGVLGEVPAEPAQLDAQEGLVLLALLRALPFPERLRVWREARGEGAEASGMSARSRRLARRFRVLVHVRRSLEMREA